MKVLLNCLNFDYIFHSAVRMTIFFVTLRFNHKYGYIDMIMTKV